MKEKKCYIYIIQLSLNIDDPFGFFYFLFFIFLNTKKISKLDGNYFKSFIFNSIHNNFSHF
jgi:hypothetical protein